jgi:hypothetical protein
LLTGVPKNQVQNHLNRLTNSNPDPEKPKASLALTKKIAAADNTRGGFYFTQSWPVRPLAPLRLGRRPIGPSGPSGKTLHNPPKAPFTPPKSIRRANFAFVEPIPPFIE